MFKEEGVSVLKILLAFLLSSLFVFFLFPVVLFLVVWTAAFVSAYAVIEAVYEKLSRRKWKWE